LTSRLRGFFVNVILEEQLNQTHKIMIFTTKELLMIKKIMVYYMSHHCSIKNPMHKDLSQIIDKIMEEM